MWKVKSVKKVNLKDGKYKGDWSGYEITIKLPDGEQQSPIEVTEGIRGTSKNETVEIKNGWLYIN